MYHYDDFDAAFVAARVEQFRDQVTRRLSGELTEEQFRPHRLMNGVYLQLHSYMLRIALPYGVLSSRQMRKLARRKVQRLRIPSREISLDLLAQRLKALLMHEDLDARLELVVAPPFHVVDAQDRLDVS